MFLEQLTYPSQAKPNKPPPSSSSSSSRTEPKPKPSQAPSPIAKTSLPPPPSKVPPRFPHPNSSLFPHPLAERDERTICLQHRDRPFPLHPCCLPCCPCSCPAVPLCPAVLCLNSLPLPPSPHSPNHAHLASPRTAQRLSPVPPPGPPAGLAVTGGDARPRRLAVGRLRQMWPAAHFGTRGGYKLRRRCLAASAKCVPSAYPVHARLGSPSQSVSIAVHAPCVGCGGTIICCACLVFVNLVSTDRVGALTESQLGLASTPPHGSHYLPTLRSGQ